jgi:hypothetical protein
VVTTAIDLMSERALIRAEVPFTRIVQHWSGDELTITEYDQAAIDIARTPPARGRGSASKALDEMSMLDDIIQSTPRRAIRAKGAPAGPTDPIRELTLSQFQAEGEPPRPILYKYHGSQDIAGSCALSTDQYFRLAVGRAIPDRLVDMIGNSSALFFPCGGLDADVRHAYQTLLRRAYRDGHDGLPRFAIVPPPRDPEPDSYRQLEMRIWPRVVEAVQRQMQITVLEANPEEVLTELIARLSA